MLFAALTRHGVDLVDVEQVVIRGRLTLGALVTAHHDPEGLQEAVEQAMASISMQVHTSLEEPDDPSARRHSTHVVVLTGRPITARAFGSIAQALADVGANIDAIRRVADYPVTGLELLVSPEPGRDSSAYPPGTLRARLVEVARTAGVDVAVERAGLARRSKRLIVFDVDSTLVQGEVIEMLAARAGAEAEVRAVTEAAMRGELDFAESLRRRVAALAGLPESVLAEVAVAAGAHPGRADHDPHPEAARLPLRGGLRRIHPGHLRPGRRAGPGLLRRQRAGGRRRAAHRTGGSARSSTGPARRSRCAGSPTRTGSRWSSAWPSGTGPTTSTCSPRPGSGIAFNAKPALREVADTALSHPYLDVVLFVLGITRDEVERADAAEGMRRRVPIP